MRFWKTVARPRVQRFLSHQLLFRVRVRAAVGKKVLVIHPSVNSLCPNLLHPQRFPLGNVKPGANVQGVQGLIDNAPLKTDRINGLLNLCFIYSIRNTLN